MQLQKPGQLDGKRLVEVDISPVDPAADEVLIEVDACAVCRTDLQIVTGDLRSRRLPIVPGHQVVGRITAVGSEIVPKRIGSSVGLAWLANACQVCRFCQSGRENLCENAQFTGWDIDGGYASHVLAKGDYAFDLPTAEDGSDPRTTKERAASLAPLLCGGTIGYRSLRIAEIDAGSAGARLGLFGYGASATLVLQLARFWGCDVYVVTRSADEAERALEAGAKWAGTYDQVLPVKLDAAITFAPAGNVVIDALRATDRGGIVAVNAIHLDRMPEFNYDDLWLERSIRSVANVTRQDVREFLDLVPRAGITTTFETLDLSQANVALQRLQDGDVRGSFVLTG